MIFYLDSSAWVKRYIDEPGTAWMGRFWAHAPIIGCASLGLVEVLATLARRQSTDPSRGMQAARRDARGFLTVSLNAEVMGLAGELAIAKRLRGADAVHLASATYLQRTLQEPVAMVTSDAELLQAAAGTGFPILDPQTDPAIPE